MGMKCIFVYFSVISLCISTVCAIFCYQCNSGLHEGCDKLSFNDTTSKYYQECTTPHEGYKLFCRKSYYKISGDESSIRINRECGYLVYKTNTSRCDELDNDYKLEINCQCYTDGCNASPKQFSQTYLIIFTTIALLVGTSKIHRF